MGKRGTGDAKMGKRLKSARRKTGLTQEALANRIGVEQNTVSDYETGAATPSREALIRLAEIVDENLGYLLAGPKKAAVPRELQLTVEALILELPKGAMLRLSQLSPEDRAQAVREIAALLQAKTPKKPLQK